MAEIYVPADFLQALQRDEYVYDSFMAMPPSHKREYLKWIEEAKRPQTRAKRIHETTLLIRKRLRKKHNE